MTLGLAVFGVAAPAGVATFVYAQLRTLRTVGRYAPPTLPRSATTGAADRIRLEPGGFDLLVWDTLLGEGDDAQALADLANGSLRLPGDCPIEQGCPLEGTPFGDVTLREGYGRVPVDGGGALLASGFVMLGGSARVVEALQKAVGREEVGEELAGLMAAMDRESGLDVVSDALQPCDLRTGREGFFSTTRRFGVVEHLRRLEPEAMGFALSARVTKVARGSLEPCREVVLTRAPEVEAVDLLVRLELRAWESVIVDRLITLPADTRQMKIDAGEHVTSLVFQAYAPGTGALVDQQEVAFVQRIGIEVALRTGADVLPSPFRGAPDSADLQERARMNSFRHDVVGPRIRSDPFGTLRAGSAPVDVFAGRRGWKAESVFFPPGPQPQVEAIRWLKRKFEGIDLAEAFLVDPFLGTEALRRVVLRQGNQSVKLTILVSPAVINPDAETMDASVAPGKHVAELVAAAIGLSDQLCGDIEMVEIRRGTGTRQAFHDRYLGLVARDGTPSVYLLSNSLSKAAGDWPFAVAELDTPRSWKVAAYVKALLGGSGDGDRRLAANPLWRSAGARPGQLPVVDAETATFDRELLAAYYGLAEIDQQGRIGDRSRTDPFVDRLAAALPDLSPVDVAAALMRPMHGREHLAVAVVHRLAEAADRRAVADALDELILERLLDRLCADPAARLLAHEPRVLLGYAAAGLARRPKGTDLVRDRMNPALDACARALEFGRSGNALARLTRGVQLTLFGLLLVEAGTTIPTRFWRGIAVDYVNQLGRLLRSVESRRYFVAEDRGRDGPGWQDARDAVGLVLSLSDAPGLDLASAAGLLLADPLLPRALLDQEGG